MELELISSLAVRCVCPKNGAGKACEAVNSGLFTTSATQSSAISGANPSGTAYLGALQRCAASKDRQSLRRDTPCTASQIDPFALTANDEMSSTISQGAQQHRWTPHLKIGLLAGLVDLAASGLVAWLMQLLPADVTGESAAAATLNSGSSLYLLLVAVVFMPLFETLLAQWLPIELARKLGARKSLCIALSAFLFGLRHFMNGGLGHGLTTFCGGLVLAYFYVKVRKDGVGTSYWVTAMAHATNNLVMCTIFLVLFS